MLRVTIKENFSLVNSETKCLIPLIEFVFMLLLFTASDCEVLVLRKVESSFLAITLRSTQSVWVLSMGQIYLLEVLKLF